MRVTENSITGNYLYNQQQILKSRTKIQMQLATNSKIQTLSDDVTASLESMKINSQIKKTDVYLDNAKKVQQFMDASLGSLDSITSQIQKIMTLAVDAENPLNANNLGLMSDSIKGSLTSIIQNVNAKHNDMPLFGGTNFRDVPVTQDADGKAVLSAEDFSGEMKTQVSQNIKQAMNIPGSKILGSGLFESINSIIDSLDAGNVPTSAQKADLEAAYKNLLNIQSLGGQTINRMDDLSQMLTTQQTNLQYMLADKQNIDPAELTIELQYKDYLLQLTNKLLAMNYPRTLFDYF
ncbi:MAG: hypothetical protein CVV24_11505 [Ignavibacteriae bacterium HGW-Ignavibacteriae-3]|nr:MAG: hypothetical protein CVV24_11505 [Ignavibacteriae bacterium HGW-Ignavibacteriae-3]